MTRIFTLFKAPRFEDEEKTRQAYLLYLILWTLNIVSILYFIYVLLFAQELMRRVLMQVIFGIAINTFLLILVRRGYVRSASIIQVAAFWIFFTATAWTSAGIQHQAYQIGYATVIAIAGLIIGIHAALIIVGISLLSGGLIVITSDMGFWSFKSPDKMLNIWVVSAILFPLLAVLQYLGGKLLRMALAQSQINEAKYRLLADNIKDQVWLMDLNLKPTYINPSVEKIRGFTFEEIVQLPLDKHLTAASLLTALEFFSIEMPKALADPTYYSKRPLELEFYCKDGSTLWVETTYSTIRDENGKPLFLLGVGRDTTERRRAEEALRQSELFLKESHRIARLGGWKANPITDYLEWTEGVYEIIGAPLDYKPCLSEGLKFFLPEYIPIIKEKVANCLITGEKFTFECESTTTTGEHLWTELRGLAPVIEGEHSYVIGTFQDINERKLAEKEKDVLQAQFIQAQKMESVGRLAGGVAHDFNNMLNVILGYAQLAMMEIPETEPVYEYLKGIKDSAVRSADLTRQLLAFARKQTISPIVLELNDTINGMLTMIRRLIGENINLVWMPRAGLWHVKIDPSQVDQLLANLLVNARDSITDVGKITIETENTTLDEAYCSVHKGFRPGEYVMLAVSDDGHGMSKDVLDHLFEPFFTTKKLGKGTGLGLCTVYGIVKQNNGFVDVYSELGKGSIFKIYLPRVADEAIKPMPAIQTDIPKSRGETVLLVEDEASLLNIVRMMLEQLDYKVLAAGTPGEALRQAKDYAAEIQLIITDIIMPEMNGKDLAKLLSGIKPGLKYLFVSGYTANVVAHRGILDEGVNFIQKPFSMQTLAGKVREILDFEKK